MATEKAPFGHQIVNNASSSHIGQPVNQPSRPLNDGGLSNRKNPNNLQDNTPGSDNSPQLYATPIRPSPSHNFTHIDPRFTNLKSHDEARMLSAQKLWEEVDYTLSKYTPEKSLAIFAGYSIGSKPALTKKAEEFPKASGSNARHPVMDGKMAVPTTGYNLNNTNKPSLTVHVPHCQEPYLNDMAFQQEIENFYDYNRISKGQARYKRDFTPVFKDSGVYMEDNFQREASKKSPIGSDLMDEAYDEGTLSGPHNSLNGLSSSDEPHGHIPLEFQLLADKKRTARSPIPEHILRELTSEEQTIQTSLALFDEANEPYVRGGTPPYDLFDLNCRYMGHSPIRMNLNAGQSLIAASMADRVYARLDKDSSTNHHTEAENETSTRLTSIRPVSQQTIKIIESGKGDINRPAPNLVASPSASLVGLTGANRWLSPPTPRWPHSPVSVDRLPSPPTPCWPDAHVSIDREKSSANPQWSSSPPHYNTESQQESQHGISSPGLSIEKIGSEAPEAPSELLPGLNRAANAGSSNGNYSRAGHPTLAWAEQQEGVPTYQAASSPTPAPTKKSTIPDKYQFLDESNSSTDSNVDGEPSLPVYPTASYNSSPPIPRRLQSSSSVETVRHRDPTKWINIAPSIHARSSSPMTDSSGFFDNGVTASFRPPLISPAVQEINDTSSTGFTQMRLSRQRAREGTKLQRPRFNYPEHPSFNDLRQPLTPNAETPLPDYGNQNAPPQDRNVLTIIEQGFVPPHLSRQSSSFDSLNTFPPTPTDGIPLLNPSSAPSTVPNPYFIAAQRDLASSVQRPSTPPAAEYAPHMPGYPRLSPSTSALELTLPNEVAGTPTPARRGPGRPKKGAKEPKKTGEIEAQGGKSAFNEWKKATARKAPKKTPVDQTPGGDMETESGDQQDVSSAANETTKTTARKAPRKSKPVQDENSPMDDEQGDDLIMPLSAKTTARKAPRAPRKRKADHPVQEGEAAPAAKKQRR